MVKFKRLIAIVAILSCFSTVPAFAGSVGLVNSEAGKQMYYTKANGITMSRLNDFLPKTEVKKPKKVVKAKSPAIKQATSNLFNNPVQRSLSYNPSIKLTEEEKAGVVEMGKHTLTFYCACSICCGIYSNGYTANGAFAAEGRTIAVDRSIIPLGSKVFIDGYGWFIAEDVGGAIKGNKIDIFKTTHQSCLQQGVKYGNVYVAL